MKCFFGKSAFDSETMGELVQKIESGSYKIPTNVSKELVSFLNGMLQYNAEKRLSVNELVRHHFLTKNIKDFEPKNVNQVSNKIRNNNLNINIKRNNTIWSFFNEEDEKKLNNIPGNYLAPLDSSINEEDEYKQDLQVENKRRNTAKIPHIIKKDNYQNYPQDFNNPHEFVKRNTQNYQGYGVGENGIHPYENTNNNTGYGYSNYPPPQPQPQMAPHFPFSMPLVVPSSLKRIIVMEIMVLYLILVLHFLGKILMKVNIHTAVVFSKKIIQLVLDILVVEEDIFIDMDMGIKNV